MLTGVVHDNERDQMGLSETIADQEGQPAGEQPSKRLQEEVFSEAVKVSRHRPCEAEMRRLIRHTLSSPIIQWHSIQRPWHRKLECLRPKRLNEGCSLAIPVIVLCEGLGVRG